MTKRRVRLGIGLDAQKLADTIQQTFDAFEDLPGLSLDAHTESGWLHLSPKAGQDATGNLTHVTGWLLTFGYPHYWEPIEHLSSLKISLPEGGKLTDWEAALFASFWLPPGAPPHDLAVLAIALLRQVQAVSEDTSVEIALEYGV